MQRSSQRLALDGAVAALGNWMARHRGWIAVAQWSVVVFYLSLLILPVLRPLPDYDARIFNNLTVFAQFLFWGIWWPFVLVSMLLFGRLWCGVLCPEGAMSEFASRYGLNLPLPRWMRWSGWPFAAFCSTTIYGQMVSVYQYPKAVVLVLGGSTVVAIVIGFLYARDRRAWCKYLCPVKGVFNLLARLAPIHFKVDEAAWKASYHGKKITPIVCAPLVPIRHMQGNAECHMCARCSGHRDAVTLALRSPAHEIVHVGPTKEAKWQTALLLYGMLGLAIGAFQWTVNPWMIALKLGLANWLINHQIMWPLQQALPWFIFTNYPQQNDVFSVLDGTLVVAWIVGVATALGSLLSALLAGAIRLIGPWQTSRFQHLALALIPLAACGLFLGLSATSISILKPEGISLIWVSPVRISLLVIANLASLALAVGILRRYPATRWRQLGAVLLVGLALAAIDSTWWFMFWGG